MEYPDIEKVCKEVAAERDGPPYYTVPFIHDPKVRVCHLQNNLSLIISRKTNKTVSDSVWIAKYLDATYPETPRLIPEGGDVEQRDFQVKFMEQLDEVWSYILPTVHSQLNPRSQEYFRRTRELSYGKKLEELTPTGREHEESWQKLELGFGKIGELMTKDGQETPFAMGDTITFADFALGGFLKWILVLWGEDSWQWKDIGIRWQGGRWGAFVNSLEKYAEIM